MITQTQFLVHVLNFRNQLFGSNVIFPIFQVTENHNLLYCYLWGQDVQSVILLPVQITFFSWFPFMFFWCKITHIADWMRKKQGWILIKESCAATKKGESYLRLFVDQRGLFTLGPVVLTPLLHRNDTVVRCQGY